MKKIRFSSHREQKSGTRDHRARLEHGPELQMKLTCNTCHVVLNVIISNLPYISIYPLWKVIYHKLIVTCIFYRLFISTPIRISTAPPLQISPPPHPREKRRFCTQYDIQDLYCTLNECDIHNRTLTRGFPFYTKHFMMPNAMLELFYNWKR